MDEQQARLILQAYRPGDQDRSDPEFAAALEAAAKNPELAQWLNEEQAFDRAVAAHLHSVPAPFGLKTRILAQTTAPGRRLSSGWIASLAALAAALALLAQGISFWRTTHARGETADYAQEMASFIKMSPPLEMESDNLNEIQSWLGKKNMAPVKVPQRLAGLAPLGCRLLSFRAHDVTLICFHREGNRLAHLFTVDRAALPKIKPGQKPIFANENGWMTATWAEDNTVYMITLQGGRAALEPYLPSA